MVSRATHSRGQADARAGQISLVQTNADVWSRGDFAYVGMGDPVLRYRRKDRRCLRSRTAGTRGDRRCPGTSAEDMEVLSVDTPAFTGDLLAVGIQQCSEEEGFGGLALWDVTDPTNPEELGIYENFGVHELSLTERPDRCCALLASPFSEPFTSFFLPAPIGDFGSSTSPTLPARH